HARLGELECRARCSLGIDAAHRILKRDEVGTSTRIIGRLQVRDIHHAGPWGRRSLVRKTQQRPPGNGHPRRTEKRNTQMAEPGGASKQPIGHTPGSQHTGLFHLPETAMSYETFRYCWVKVTNEEARA